MTIVTDKQTFTRTLESLAGYWLMGYTRTGITQMDLITRRIQVGR